MNSRHWLRILKSGPFLLLTGSVVTVLIVVLGFGYLQAQRQEVEHLARENLAAVLAGKSAAIADWIQERKDDGHQVFEDSRLRRFLADPQDVTLGAEIEQWMESMQRDYGYAGLVLLDQNRRRLLESSVGVSERFAGSSSEVDQAWQKRGVGISEIHRSPVDNTIHFAVTVPIEFLDATGERATGLMMMVINSEDYLFPLVQHWPYKSDTSEALLVRRESDEVLFLHDLRHQTGAALTLRFPMDDPDLPAAASFGGDHSNVREGLDYREVPVMAATGPVPGTSWHMVVKTDKAEVYAGFNRNARNWIIQMGLLLTLLWLGGLSIWRRNRVERLKEELEQKQASEAMALDAAMRLSLATKTTGLGVWEWRVSEGKMLWDEQMFRMYGWDVTADHFVSYDDWRAAVWPEDLKKREASLQGTKRGSPSQPVEFRITRADTGEVRHLVSIHASRFNEAADAQVVVGTSLDITDRKRAEAEMQSGLDRIKLATEVTGVGIWEWDIATGELHWDQRMFGIYGLRPDSDGNPVYQDWLRTVLPEDLAAQEETLQKTIATKGRSQREFRIRRANDQHLRTIVAVETVRLNESGEVKSLVGSNLDITDQRNAENEIKRLSTVVEQCPVSIVITDLGGNIKYINPHFSQLTGYAPEEVLGKNPRILKSGETPSEHYAEMWREITAGRNWSGLFHNRRKDGSLFWEEAYISPMTDHRDKVTGYVAIKSDVSARIRAEQEISDLNHNLEDRVHQRTQELEYANQELESFSYSVSHDLRAPLRAIDGWAQVLLEDFGPVLQGEGGTALNRLRAATQRMGALIDDLLRLSRINREALEPRLVGMRKLVDEVIMDLEAGHPGMVSAISIGPLADGEGSAVLLRQVWANLIGNAFKFTRQKESPQIKVGSRIDPDGHLVYFVKDNGAGFDMRYADKLFGAFQRLHSAREFEGSGIGLALSQRIIRRHGGRIWAEGEVGVGAEFCFSLNPASPGQSSPSTLTQSDDR